MNRRKRNRQLDRYVKFSIAAIVIYSIVEMTISSITGIEHSTLTTCFYSCFGGEILSCCLIKIFKLKGERDEYRSEFYNEQSLLQAEPDYRA